ncbi:MAG: diaminopimelate epimerase [Actinobacteria bacterium]|nr:diaminopimelate epimerase [Actinomycetota bacterium]
MHLTKHHGLGNDFLVVLDERNGRAVDVDGELARRLCDRHRGIGADGLLHGSVPVDAGTTPDIDIVMHLFNADGGPAEMSGNGIRCFAQAVAMARGVNEGALRVSTDAGIRVLDLLPGRGRNELLVTVDMGAAKLGPSLPKSVGAEAGGPSATADLGNPHLVVLLDGGELPRGDELARRGSALEANFTEGINVEFVRVLDRDHAELTVWERGSGVTAACGTGACATAWVLNGWDKLDSRATISMPGGDADVLVATDDRVTLIGPTEHIADIEVS